MEIGLGILRHPPQVLWSLTLPEFMAAWAGFLDAHGAKPVDEIDPLTSAEQKRLDVVTARVRDEQTASERLDQLTRLARKLRRG